MSENKFASPAGVREEVSQDEKWRRNAKSLRIAAWGLTLASLSMGLIVALMAMFVVSDMIWPLSIVNQFLANVRELIQWAMTASAISSGMGVVMCLACGRETARFGRWLIPLCVVCLAWPGMAILEIDFGLVEMLGHYEHLLAMTFFIGLALWGVFLWLLAWTMKIPHAAIWIVLTVVVWVILTVWSSPLMDSNRDFARMHRLFYREVMDNVLPVVGLATCVTAMWTLRSAIMRGLRMVCGKSGDERDEK